MTGRHDVARLRLAAQRIVGPRPGGAVDAVRWMTAMQAQDHRGALVSVALRTTSGTRLGVQDALDAGEVVKSWPMRGTLHLVAAEDLPWMLELMAPRVLAGSLTRRTGLGLDDIQLERAREVSVDALARGARLRRSELLELWADAGLAPEGSRGTHILRYLAMTGTLVFGPTRAGEQLLVRSDEWIPRPRRLEREEALGELARRYFLSHGPATTRDFARWTNLVAEDVRIGVGHARPGLASLDVDGTEHLMDPGTPGRLAAAGGAENDVVLLPGFDELLLGYADRSAVLDPEFAGRVVPGGNGIFRPTVISAGRVVGTWRHAARRTGPNVVATPFAAFTDDVAAAIPRVHDSLP